MSTSTYAVLGATGNCGNSLIQILLQNPSNEIRAYCRNAGKFHKSFPELASNKRVSVLAGNITDVELMKRVVGGTKAVFLVATMNDNMPGCRVAQDAAISVIAALKAIKEESEKDGQVVKMPKIVVLSSATIDPHLSRNMPSWFHPIMIRAGSFVYKDLEVQEQLLRAEEDWLTSIYIKPGGLSVDPKQRGHKLDFDDQESFIGYLDLAAAMIEAAEDPSGLYDGRNVSVKNANGSAKFPKGTPLCIVYGLLRHYFPKLHPYIPSAGPS